MADQNQENDQLAQLREQVKLKRLREQVAAKRAQEQLDAERGPSAGEKAEAAVSGFGESATFGYLPEIQAATEPVSQAIYEAVTGEDLGEAAPYEERLGGYRQSLAETQAKAPGYALGGELAGFAIPGAGAAKGAQAVSKLARAARIAKGAKAGKGLQTAGRLAEGSLMKGPMSQRIAGMGTLGAAESALYNPDYVDPETGQVIEQDKLQQIMTGGAFAAAVPPALKAVGAAVKPAVYAGKKFMDASGWAGKKFLSAGFGVEEAKIKEYLENPELITKAQDFQAVKNAIDDIVNPIRKELDEAEISFKEAQERVRRAEARIVSDLKDEDNAIKKAFQEAKTTLDREYKTSYDQLNKVAPPLYLQDTIETSLDRLKTQVVKGSDEAMQVLQKELKGQEINIEGAATILDDALDGLRIKKPGKEVLKEDFLAGIPEAGEARPIALQIKALQDDIASFGGKLTPYDAKRYIKQLDNYIDWGEGEFGKFSRPDVNAAKNVRRYLDKSLKEASPGYAEVMAQVAEDAAALSEARQYFGKSRRIASSLNSIDKAVNNDKRMALRELGARTGVDLTEDVEDYIKTKNELKKLSTLEGKEEFYRNLDSYEDFQKAKDRLAELENRHDLQKQVMIQRAKNKSRESQELAAATARKANAEAAVEMVKTFRETSSEQKLSRAMTVLNSGKRGEGMTLRQEFEKLTQMGDQDFLELISSLQMQEAFSRDFIRGSRNVNAWQFLGMGVGDVFTGRTGMGGAVGAIMGGPVGIIAGSIMGLMVDKYGPAMTKRMLDGVLSIKGIPTVQKIKKLDLPNAIKDDLVRDFRATYIAGFIAGQPVDVAPEDIPRIREDVTRNEMLDPMTKAKVLAHLNRHGELIHAEKIADPEFEQSTSELKKRGLMEAQPMMGGGQYRDTGRQYGSGEAPLEMLESGIGGPFRSFLDRTLEGDPLGGIRMAKSRFLRDPALSPSYEQILERQGMKEGIGRTASAIALSMLEPGIPGIGAAKAGVVPGMAGTVKKVDNVLQFPTKLAKERAEDAGTILRRSVQEETVLPFSEKTPERIRRQTEKLKEAAEARSKKEQLKAIKKTDQYLEDMRSELSKPFGGFATDIQVERTSRGLKATLDIAPYSDVDYLGGAYNVLKRFKDRVPKEIKKVTLKGPEETINMRFDSKKNQWVETSRRQRKKVIEAASKFRAFGKRPTVEGEAAPVLGLRQGGLPVYEDVYQSAVFPDIVEKNLKVEPQFAEEYVRAELKAGGRRASGRELLEARKELRRQAAEKAEAAQFREGFQGRILDEAQEVRPMGQVIEASERFKPLGKRAAAEPQGLYDIGLGQEVTPAELKKLDKLRKSRKFKPTTQEDLQRIRGEIQEKTAEKQARMAREKAYDEAEDFVMQNQVFNDDQRVMIERTFLRKPEKMKELRKLMEQGAEDMPYVYDKDVGGFAVMSANYNPLKTGVMGDPDVIAGPESGFLDAFAWMDDKFKWSKDWLKRLNSVGKSVEINTASDLIGKDDYAELIPKGSKVNLWFSGMPDSNVDQLPYKMARSAFPGKPSDRRLMDTYERLKQAGVDVEIKNIIDVPKYRKQVIERLKKAGYKKEQIKEVLGE